MEGTTSDLLIFQIYSECQVCRKKAVFINIDVDLLAILREDISDLSNSNDPEEVCICIRLKFSENHFLKN